jgi:hypothetical protein
MSQSVISFEIGDTLGVNVPKGPEVWNSKNVAWVQLVEKKIDSDEIDGDTECQLPNSEKAHLVNKTEDLNLANNQAELLVQD